MDIEDRLLIADSLCRLLIRELEGMVSAAPNSFHEDLYRNAKNSVQSARMHLTVGGLFEHENEEDLDSDDEPDEPDPERWEKLRR